MTLNTMNTYFYIAGLLCILLGIAHSIFGELLIFRNKRNNGHIIPSRGSIELRESHLRIIWATWHLASVFGFCLGTMLILLATIEQELDQELLKLVTYPITNAVWLGALLVLVGTKARHPGWIVLLIIGILLVLGNL